MCAKEDAERGYHHGALRRALMDVTDRLLEHHDPETITLRRVARMAGVSAAAPYRHFRDRDELFAAVAQEGWETLHASILESMHDEPDPLLRYRDIGMAYVRFALTHPGTFRVMAGSHLIQHERYPALAEAAGATIRLLEGAIAECQELGLVRADLMPLAQFSWSLVHGLAQLLLSGQFDEADREAFVTRTLQLAFEGVRSQ